MEAVGMYSADGEYVEFNHPVILEGPVEVTTAPLFQNVALDTHTKQSTK